MAERKKSRKKWLLTIAKVLIVVLVVWAIRRTIVDAVDQLDEHTLRLNPWWLIAAGGLYLLGLLPAGLFWHRVLLALGQDAKLGETLRAYFIGHLGKYVPGKAMVVVLRTGLIRSHRVDTGLAAVSVFFETLTMMTVGAFISAAILAFYFREHWYLTLVALGLMAGAGMPTLPPVFRRLVKFAGIGKSNPETAEKLQNLGGKTLALGWLAMSIGWVILGLSLWAVLRGMGVEQLIWDGKPVPLDPISQLPLYVAAVSLAMVAGFLSLIPGGAAVREAVLAELLVPHFGEVTALVSAVLLRLVWLGSELLLSGILWVSLWKRSGSTESGRD